MKRQVVVLLGFAANLYAAPEAARTAWQWQAPVDVVQPGMVRLELPPPVLDATRPDLGDLRVVSPAGVETAWLLEVVARDVGNVRNAAGFKVELAGKTTVIEVTSPTAAVIEAVEFVTPAREFLKSVTLEGRQADGEWRNLATHEVIFRQSGGAERLRVPVLAAAWEGFRCTVDDGRAQPVPFTGVRLVTAGRKPETVESPVVVGSRKEVAGQTWLTLDLGARNLDIAELCLEIQDAVFSRPCSLRFSMPAPNDPARMESLVDHVLYRVAGERDVSAESIILPLRRRIPGRYLIATFRNGDSPPLRITGAKIRCYPTVLAYYADSAGAWQLLTGCRDAKAPDYDLSPLRGALAAAGGHRTLPGTPQAKPDYQAPPALPGVGTAGAEISLTAWSRRRAVHAATAGVIRVELDEKALAGCRDDLGDLRLVRNGRQIPYLVQRSYAGSAMRDLKPSKVTELNDPKRPTVSRWEITLPVANLPAVDVTARSPSPLFTRRFVVTIQRKDVLGNVWTDNAGTADWTKSGGDDSRLVLGLGRQRLTQTFILETDNGDNPPIDLADIAVRSAGASVTAKLVGDDPLFLYYGNPKATPPQYDLRLAGDELIAADQHAANLGDEEILHPDARQTGAADAGSPWLWLALAGVVAVLLVIVAKLLPRPTAG